MEAGELGQGELRGHGVRLEPLEARHLGEMAKVSGDARIWEWFRWDLSGPEGLEARFKEQERGREAGAEAHYAVVLNATGETAGGTSFLNVDGGGRTVSIGATWFAPRFWGTAVNPESKLLMLGRAFDGWGAIRVALQADDKNARSKSAILALGAKREGTLRWHMRRRDGSFRDTAAFSIIRPEWPAVKKGLEARLLALAGQGRPGT